MCAKGSHDNGCLAAQLPSCNMPDAPESPFDPRLGLGLDAVEVDRIAEAIERHGERFLARVFTPAERVYCSAQPAPAQHYAARFAAKEAVLKLLRTGWAEGLGFTEIEVVRAPSGAPGVRLHGRAAVQAAKLELGPISLSLTHTRSLAMAVVAASPRRADSQIS
jgi:holo-[acyl-carrier protein] synthase